MPKQLIDSESGMLLKEYSDDKIIREYNPYNFKRATIKKTTYYRFYKSSVLIFKDKDIKLSDLKVYFSLVELLDFDNNEFVKINGIVANIKLISKFLGIPRKTLQKHIKLLEKKELLLLIKKGREKNILINPYVINFGKSQTDESLNLFGKSIWVNRMKESKKN